MKVFSALFSLLLAESVNSQPVCLKEGLCETQVTDVVNDLRARITDRLQSEVESNLGIAPTVVKLTSDAFSHGILQHDMSNANFEGALLEHFWNQLQNFEEVDWVYFGHGTTGDFIGFRRAYACEMSASLTCNYGSGVPTAGAPTLTAGTLVRLITTGTTVNAFSTNPSGDTGSDAVAQLYSETGYVTTTRDWYTFGLQQGSGWTAPYVFSGGRFGISYVQRITIGGVVVGVLAADYEMDFLSNFINNIPVAGNSYLFVVSATGELLANNKGTSVISNNSPLQASASEEPFKSLTAAVQAAEPRFSDPAATWTAITKETTVGQAAVSGVTYKYDAIGIQYNQLKWMVVIASVSGDFYVAERNNILNCVEQYHCRGILSTAASDLRFRTLSHLRLEINNYLGSALSAIRDLDQIYNNGNFAENWCTTCGMIDIENAVERDNLKKYIKSIMTAYTELYWVYVGFEGGRFIGYKRVPGQTDPVLWTCHPPNDYTTASCQQAAFYTSDTEPLGAASEVVTGQHPTTRPWYTDAISNNLGLQQALWTEPYQFGEVSGTVVGISAVKRALNGDWRTDSTMGVWAADFSLSGISAFMKEFSVANTIVMYIMDRKGTLIASNKDLPTMVKASQSTNALVAATAGLVGQATSSIQHLIHEGDNQFYFVDYTKITDTSTDIIQSYDWTLVIVTPEAEVYNIDIIDNVSDDDDGLAGWAIAVIIVSVLVCILIIATGVMYAKGMLCCSGSEPESKREEEEIEVEDHHSVQSNEV